MIDSEILQKLARSGQLAARTHNRALTRSLLSKALDCSLVYEATPRPHLADTRREQSHHRSYRLRDFSSNSLEHDGRSDGPPENWTYYRSFVTQQGKEQHRLEQVTNKKHREQLVEANDVPQNTRRHSDYSPVDSRTIKSSTRDKKYVRSDDDYIFMKKTAVVPDDRNKENLADDDHIVNQKNIADDEHIFMKRTDVVDDKTAGCGKKIVRTKDGNGHDSAEKCFQCTNEVDSRGHYVEDDHVLVDDTHRHMQKRDCSKRSGKGHLGVREVDDGQQGQGSSSDQGEKDCPPLPELCDDSTDKGGQEDLPEEPNIDVTMRSMSEMMSNISHLCECYYDSCDKETLSHAEKRHLRTFHKGVLPVKQCAQHKKVMKNSTTNKEISSSSCSSALDSEARSYGVRFSGTGASLNRRLDRANKNSHYTQDSGGQQNIYRCATSLGRAQSLHGSRASKAHRDRFSSPALTDSESETDTFMHSNKVRSEDTLCPVSASSSTCESLDSKVRLAFAKHDRSRLGARKKDDDDVTGVCLSKNSILEGISAFPTHNISFRPNSVKSKKKATKNNVDQGIYLTTKPGTYVLRKPQQKSSIHLLHVNPGNYIKFKM